MSKILDLDVNLTECVLPKTKLTVLQRSTTESAHVCGVVAHDTFTEPSDLGPILSFVNQDDMFFLHLFTTW